MKVTATEFQQNVGRFQDAALRRPITITKNNRDHVVLLAAEEYKRLLKRSRAVLLAGELSDDVLAAIARTEMPAGREELNAELDD
jgi:prevent-host-death family protein